MSSKKTSHKKNKSDSASQAEQARQTPGGKGRRRRGRADDPHPRVMISGYYGFDNLGDELILRVLTTALKERGAEITVLSKNPEKTRRDYGVNAISRTNLPDIVDALAKTHLFISGGGGLFQDVTGPMSTLYYGGLIHLAAFFEVPVCFWAQGVGPLHRSLSRKLTASALRKCDAIVVRDEGSAALIDELIGFRPHVTADPVWLLTHGHRDKTANHTADSAAGKRKEKKKYALPSYAESRPWKIGISLRPWPELTTQRLNHLAACLQGYAASLERPVELWLLPFQRSEDVALLTTFADRLRKDGPASVVLRSPEQALDDAAHCDMLLGMRFHSLILGLLYGVPVYGIPYDPKVASLLATFDLHGCPVEHLDNLSSEMIQNAMAHYPAVNLKPLQKQAQRNLLLLDELLAIPESDLVL